MRATHWLTLTLALAPLGACGPRSIDVPTPPSWATAAAAPFNQPTGSVPPETQAAAMDAQDRLNAVSESRVADLLADALSRLRERLALSKLPADPAAEPSSNGAKVDGYLTVHRVCRGWNDTAETPDPANGSVDLTAVLHEGILQRQLWAIATTCKGRIDVGQMAALHPYLDGKVAVYLEQAVPNALADAHLAVHLDGTFGTEQRTRQTVIDFRVLAGMLEVPVPVPDGQIVASAGQGAIQLRGTNGTFVVMVPETPTSP